MAICFKAIGSSAMTAAAIISGHDSRTTFPFMKLPPEIRSFIYEQVFLDIVQAAEAVAFYTKDMTHPDYHFPFIVHQVNALPITCRIIRKESAYIYNELSFSILDSRLIELEDLRYTQSLGLPFDRFQEITTECNEYAVDQIDQVVWHIEENITRYRSLRDMTQQYLSFGTSICMGVQNRLHNGDGVRTALEAEIRSQVGVQEATHDEMALLIHLCVGYFSALKTVQRPPSDNRVSRFRQRAHQAYSSSRHRIRGSIRYVRKSMKLCPNNERAIFVKVHTA
jgi:hypothetical protein